MAVDQVPRYSPEREIYPPKAEKVPQITYDLVKFAIENHCWPLKDGKPLISNYAQHALKKYTTADASGQKTTLDDLRTDEDGWRRKSSVQASLLRALYVCFTSPEFSAFREIHHECTEDNYKEHIILRKKAETTDTHKTNRRTANNTTLSLLSDGDEFDENEEMELPADVLMDLVGGLPTLPSPLQYKVPATSDITTRYDSMLDDPFQMYLRDTQQYSLLSGADEIDLAKRIKNDPRSRSLIEKRLLLHTDLEKLRGEIDNTAKQQDIAALREQERKMRQEIITINKQIQKTPGGEATLLFIEANLRLVVSIAKRYVGRGVSLPDLVEEGNIGLMRAVEKFDWQKGFKFSTYATWWIRQATTRAIADQGRTIRIPVGAFEDMNRLFRQERLFLQDNGREPTEDELAKAAGMTPEKVRELVAHYSQQPISLDAPIGEEEDTSLGDLLEDTRAVEPHKAAYRQLLKATVAEALSPLSQREQEVLRLRFGLNDDRDRTLEEVGGALGITRERVRQIEAGALSKLRISSRRNLEDYWE